MSRIYSNKTIDELQAIFITDRSDQSKLNKLRQELSYRGSSRAKRLMQEVENLLPPLQTNAHWVKQPTRELPTPVLPIDKEIAEFQRFFGLELVRMRGTLAEKVKELTQLFDVRDDSAETLASDLFLLRSRLQAHVASIVPDAPPVSDAPLTEYERRRQLTRVTLVQQAARSFPDYARIAPTEESARKAKRESDQTSTELAQRKATLAKLDEFLNKNQIQLQIEIENQVVKLTAEEMTSGADDIRLLEFIKSFKLSDPVGVLTRVHMYVNNVLKTR